MPAFLSINGYAGQVTGPFTGQILGLAEPQSHFAVAITGGISGGSGVPPSPVQVILEGTNDIVGYQQLTAANLFGPPNITLPQILGWTLTAANGYQPTPGAPAVANWLPILQPTGEVMTTLNRIWNTRKLHTQFNAQTPGQPVFPCVGIPFAAVRARVLGINIPIGSLIMGVSIASRATDAI